MPSEAQDLVSASDCVVQMSVPWWLPMARWQARRLKQHLPREAPQLGKCVFVCRSAVIQNLDIDMVGFTEAVRVEGKACIQSLLDHCIICSSGDDAIHVGGHAQATVRRCKLVGRKCGIKSCERSRAELLHCNIEGCGNQGVRVMESSHVQLTGCK